jgi:hypothetical protein
LLVVLESATWRQPATAMKSEAPRMVRLRSLITLDFRTDESERTRPFSV